MAEKIKIQVYGIEDLILGGGSASGGCGGCSSKGKQSLGESKVSCCGSVSNDKGSGCGGCGSKKGESGGCGSKTPKTVSELYRELVEFIEGSDVKDKTVLEFIDINKINILDYDDVRYLYDGGYELPYCVIDGIVRYYGGISNELILNDIKELL